MDDSNDFNIVARQPIEHQKIADGDHPRLRRDIGSRRTKPRELRERLESLDDTINQPVRRAKVVYGDIEPDVVKIGRRFRRS